MRATRWRAEVNKHLSVDSEVVYADDIKKACPQLDITCAGHAPILGGLCITRRGPLRAMTP